MKIVTVRTFHDNIEYLVSIDHIALVCPQAGVIIIDAPTGTKDGVIQIDDESMARVLQNLNELTGEYASNERI